MDKWQAANAVHYIADFLRTPRTAILDDAGARDILALDVERLGRTVATLRSTLEAREQRVKELEKLTVVQAGITGHPPRSDKLFDAYSFATLHEEAMFEALLAACGIDPNDYDSWPMETWSYDWYDNSFEFWGCNDYWTPTDEQLQACFALGFSRCWINYLDGTERSAGFGNGKFWPLGERRRGHREPREEGGPRNVPVAKLNELRAALASRSQRIEELTREVEGWRGAHA